MFDSDVIAEIKSHARSEYPKESCGLVINGRYFACLNTAEDPYKDFTIDNGTYLDAVKLGLDAVVHSHPDGKRCPSGSDMRSQIAMDVKWGILVVTKEIVSDIIWWGGDTPIPPLLERPFVHGITDCYALIRDYYRLEQNIFLPDWPRDMEWWNKNQDLYMDNFAEQGFTAISVATDAPQIGDACLCKLFSSVNNHAGVYVGDGLILHHLQNRISCHEPVYRWMNHISIWLRYTGKK